MRWSKEMTNSRDSEAPRPEHRVPDRQSLSTLSPNTSQRFQQRQEAAFRHSHTAQLSLPSSHSRAPAQQLLPRSLCSRGSIHKATDCEGASPSHTPCRTLSKRPHAHSFPPHTLGCFRHAHRVSVTLSASQFSLSHAVPLTLRILHTHKTIQGLSLSHTHTHAPARSLRVRLPHTTVH